MHGPLSVRSWSVSSLVVGASRWEHPLMTEHCMACFLFAFCPASLRHTGFPFYPFLSLAFPALFAFAFV